MSSPAWLEADFFIRCEIAEPYSWKGFGLESVGLSLILDKLPRNNFTKAHKPCYEPIEAQVLLSPKFKV